MRKRSIPTLVTIATLLAGAVLAPAAEAGTPDSQPDALIKKGALISEQAADYKGYQVYNHTGSGQSITKRARPGNTVKMVFAGINGGDMQDDIGIIGCKSAGPVVVHWLVPGSTSLGAAAATGEDALTLAASSGPSVLVDVTDEVQDGILYDNVNPGAGYGFVMKAKVKNNARRSGTFSCYFDTGSAVTDLYDTVVGKIKVRA